MLGPRWIVLATSGLAALAAFGVVVAAAGIAGSPDGAGANGHGQVAGTVSASAPGDSASGGAGVTGFAMASASGDVAFKAGSPSATTAPADSASVSSEMATVPSGSTTQDASVVEPHANGHGCDDVIHGDDRTPGPGGPVGCTVGNSGDNRQNGAKAASTATATGTAASGGTPAAATPAGAEGDDPHANGHGCDDILLGGDATPGPGGPVGCTVGNSGSHRKNGAGAATETPTPSAAGATTTSPGQSGAAKGGKGGASGKPGKP